MAIEPHPSPTLPPETPIWTCYPVDQFLPCQLPNPQNAWFFAEKGAGKGLLRFQHQILGERGMGLRLPLSFLTHPTQINPEALHHGCSSRKGKKEGQGVNVSS